MRQISCAFTIIVLTGSIFCQDLAEILKSQISKFPNPFQVVNEKCVQNGGDNNTFDILKNEAINFNVCLEPLINFDQVQEELEEAKKVGAIDDVMVKYCRRYPEMYKCAENLTETLDSCLAANQHGAMNQSLEFLNTLKEYMCFNDGNKVALFISQGGVECMQSRQVKLQECVNGTEWGRTMSNMTNFVIPQLVISNKECNDLAYIQTCFYSEMATCKPSIPANVVAAFFKFLKNEFSCNSTASFLNEQKRNDKLLRYSILTVFLIIDAIIIYKLAT